MDTILRVVFIAFLNVYLLETSLSLVQSAAAATEEDNATTSIEEGSAQRFISLYYPESVSAHDSRLLDHDFTQSGGVETLAYHTHGVLRHRRGHGKRPCPPPPGRGVPRPRPFPGHAGGMVVVAKDGSGRFRTFSEAAALANSVAGNTRFHIHVKQGEYYEPRIVHIKRTNVLLTGDGIGATIITGNKHALHASLTPTFVASGAGFLARDITFRNTAGPSANQAVAMQVKNDAIFYKCSFEGYQDTLYVAHGKQYYRECEVRGTIDFIFGDATAVIQNSCIILRKPEGKSITITAQGRMDHGPTGLVIHNSVITADNELRSENPRPKIYLGRPWGYYSRTVFIKTDFGDLIDPQGWLPWEGKPLRGTTYYAEFGNRGASADTRGRLRWPGNHGLISRNEAEQFSVGRFLGMRRSEVPITVGL